ncbi:MAG: PilZ domain-containing protein [Spirochaetaceae bacterium]|nr:PilZ domain-containing protein [Myxococcales bacterium]MCB9726566.1 PilZ domain-containing protein [Spirochaetaceae bacterium]HPG26038.1 PilZ domain-containing protein [Myxococcota bacterium]
MPTGHFVLLIESDPARTKRLAVQLVRLGIEPIRVADLEEAAETVKSRQYAVAAVLIPADLPGRQVAKAMKSMRRREPVLPAMAYGKVPSSAQRSDLRRADVLLALWDGYDEGVLRFQINRLVSGEAQSAIRSSRRAPIHAPTRMLVGGREKNGILYNLSEGGCFIETSRASMDGARLKLIFTIGEQPLELDGVVAFSNVPGNLQRPNLPLGMGVRFENLDAKQHATIARFIHERMEALEV